MPGSAIQSFPNFVHVSLLDKPNSVCWIYFCSGVGWVAEGSRTATDGLYSYPGKNSFLEPHLACCPDDGLPVECALGGSPRLGLRPHSSRMGRAIISGVGPEKSTLETWILAHLGFMGLLKSKRTDILQRRM